MYPQNLISRAEKYQVMGVQLPLILQYLLLVNEQQTHSSSYCPYRFYAPASELTGIQRTRAYEYHQTQGTQALVSENQHQSYLLQCCISVINDTVPIYGMFHIAIKMMTTWKIPGRQKEKK